MLLDLIKTYETSHKICTVTNVRTVAELLNISNSKALFREVYKPTKIFTISVTTVTAERTFSALRHLKTFLRSTLCQPNLDCIMLLHAHKEQIVLISWKLPEFIRDDEIFLVPFSLIPVIILL